MGVDLLTYALLKKHSNALASNKADKLTEGNYTKGNIIISGEDGNIADSGVPLRSVVESWDDVARIVGAGMAPKVFSIGDQLECKRHNDILTWDVIGFNHDIPSESSSPHSMTIQMHDCYKALQFDAVEALYYAEEELPAGTYNFSLLAGYDVAYGGGKTFYFTLTQPVPAGGQILFPWGYQIQSDAVKIATYADRITTTAIESDIPVTEGDDGTPLAPTNHTHRVRYGSNNYSESAIRQWLNSEAPAGEAWTPQTIYDRPPSWVNSEAGFLNGIDADFLAAIGAVTKRTARNNISDGGGYYDISTDKIFLLARGETGMDNEGGINEGEPYEYYANMLVNGVRNDGALDGRIKYLGTNARYWWLRSPDVSHATNVRSVSTSGAVRNNGAHDANGVSPACNIIYNPQ